VFGSGGRAAAALGGHVDRITLHTYARADTAKVFQLVARQYGFELQTQHSDQTVSFEYIHSLAPPLLIPSLRRIRPNPPIKIAAENVLRFGMMEGHAIVTANRRVYDPQSPDNPESFAINGSTAETLAIVGNRSEITALAKADDPIAAARKLCVGNVAIVVVKLGPDGAVVVSNSEEVRIPAYLTKQVWTVGSGDVFAAHFAARWAVDRDSPADAAQAASRAVAHYVESMALPSPSKASLMAMTYVPAKVKVGGVYLASPFFTMAERWLVDEARRALNELGVVVFSPVHDVGPGPAHEVAPADLAALDKCDAIFAIIDGLDAGTLFEVGYARSKNKPVYALAQATSDEDLKMIAGSGCKIFGDFVTAVHHAAWRSWRRPCCCRAAWIQQLSHFGGARTLLSQLTMASGRRWGKSEQPVLSPRHWP
jgi:nucleoside 2-deoxyribosyltransferase